MIAIYRKHDQFSPRLRNRLKTAGMALGLVRLLQDAGRADEARAVLLSLPNDLWVPAMHCPAQKGEPARFSGQNLFC